MPTPPEQLNFQLCVELDEVKPTVWRQILVPTSVRMSRLHGMIQAAMGWTDPHLHAFTVGDERFGMCFDDYPEGEIDEQTVTVLRALRGHAFTVGGEDSRDTDAADGRDTAGPEAVDSREPRSAVVSAVGQTMSKIGNRDQGGQ
jgi:hypothetical protein